MPCRPDTMSFFKAVMRPSLSAASLMRQVQGWRFVEKR